MWELSEKLRCAEERWGAGLYRGTQVRVCGVEYYPLELASGAGEQGSPLFGATGEGWGPTAQLLQAYLVCSLWSG